MTKRSGFRASLVLAAGAIALSTFALAQTKPKLPPKVPGGTQLGGPALPKNDKVPLNKKFILPRIPIELLPLRIADFGYPIVCQRNKDCKIEGRLGDGQNRQVRFLGDDGNKYVAVTSRWTPTVVTFRLPPRIPRGIYTLEVVDPQSQVHSNAIRVVAQPDAVPPCTSPDADGDGSNAIACGGDDCDDGNNRRRPGATEVCDNADLDEDCDPSTVGVRDTDGDQHVDMRCCNGANCGSDCDDSKPGVHRRSPEVCNHFDDDCDGMIDEGVDLTLYRDADGDRFGNLQEPRRACCQDQGAGWVSNNTDCNDAVASVHPANGNCK